MAFGYRSRLSKAASSEDTCADGNKQCCQADAETAHFRIVHLMV